jgi:hypothetical protein
MWFRVKKFLKLPVTSFLFNPNILLSTLFSNILSLCPSFNVRNQVWHPYRTMCNFIALYTLIFFKFLDSRPDWTVASIRRIQAHLNFLMNQVLIYCCNSQIFELCHIFKWSITYLYILILHLRCLRINFLCHKFYSVYQSKDDLTEIYQHVSMKSSEL